MSRFIDITKFDSKKIELFFIYLLILNNFDKMIKNISQIISNNNDNCAPNKITKIYYYCEGHERAGYQPSIDLNEKHVSVCKNCGKFQCNLHINKNRDLCVSCVNFYNVCPRIDRYSSSGYYHYFKMCYYCSKISCNCYQKWQIFRNSHDGYLYQNICDEHYEECKFDPNVEIFGKI